MCVRAALKAAPVVSTIFLKRKNAIPSHPTLKLQKASLLLWKAQEEKEIDLMI